MPLHERSMPSKCWVMCMCVYVCVCMCVCVPANYFMFYMYVICALVYVCIQVKGRESVCMYVRTYMCTYSCMYARQRIAFGTCVCIRVFVSVHACMHPYTTNTHINTRYTSFHQRLDNKQAHVCAHTYLKKSEFDCAKKNKLKLQQLFLGAWRM